MTELAGHMIHERYRFDIHLGEGTFSKVYRVHDMRRNVDLAAKVLKADVADNPEFLERFRREGQVLSRLQHPHIVRYYDLIETDEIVFILMDYIPGQTLQSYFHHLGRPMTVDEVFNYLKPLTAALHYA
ncbi:MAG: serine/threonine protein kinase, partial [Phototrophicales bacterium]